MSCDSGRNLSNWPSGTHNWGVKPNGSKTHGSELRAMSNSGYNSEVSDRIGLFLSIARNIILHVGAPFCRVQYGSPSHCTPRVVYCTR
jgi:hypothetical protein